MKVAVLHDRVPENATEDQRDVLIEIETVSKALRNLGYEPVNVTFTLNIEKVIKTLRAVKPAFVFNLVESVEGQGQMIHIAPSILDYCKIPYTGAGTDAIYITSNKLLTKRLFASSHILTPPWVSAENFDDKAVEPETSYIIKSLWEHASVGLDEDSIVHIKNAAQLRRELNRRKKALGNCYAEAYIEGREFNLSLLAEKGGPEVLPPAEIIFDNYPPGKKRIVGYRAKWVADSFEFKHTPRTFDFPKEDTPLLKKMIKISRKCWDIFGLRGYARVDFRVDNTGNPWALEINVNPCISPDGGFFEATEQAGLCFDKVIERIIADSPAGSSR